MWGTQLPVTGLEAGELAGRGSFRVAGATESLSAGALAGGLEPLLVAVGHRTQMPTFSFPPLTDGDSNEEDLCWGAISKHHGGRREAVF